MSLYFFNKWLFHILLHFIAIKYMYSFSSFYVYIYSAADHKYYPFYEEF